MLEIKIEKIYKISKNKYDGFLKRMTPIITEIIPKMLKITKKIATSFITCRMIFSVESIKF
jgi:hypothetical protein